jgi:hypothetical protein
MAENALLFAGLRRWLENEEEEEDADEQQQGCTHAYEGKG